MISSTMKKIYIAGPYKADTAIQRQKNIDRARDAAATLYRRGWAPFCPHTMSAYFDDDYPDIERETYLETDLEWLRCCDAIFLLPGWMKSKGAREEHAEAERLGIKVYGGCVSGIPVAKHSKAGEDEVLRNPQGTHFGRIRIDDIIHHPPHYTQGTLECIDAIEGLRLPFHEAQVLKYLVRWRLKGGVEDLLKARWYLDRLTAQETGSDNPVIE